MIYGEKFKILSKNKDWIKVKMLFDNYVGYIKNSKYVINFFHNIKLVILKQKFLINQVLKLIVGFHLGRNYQL